MNGFHESLLRMADEKGKSAADIILSYVGNILSLIYFATPSIQIIKAYKSKAIKNPLDGKAQDAKEAVPLYLLALLLSILLNCLLWLLNAFCSDSIGDWIPLLISNGIGLIINLVIVFLYLYLLLERNIKHFLFYGFFTVNVLVEISYLMFRYIIEQDKDGSEEKTTHFHAIGFAATIINVCMYSSPIFNIIKIVKQKSTDLLPIFTLGVGFFTTITFTIQGVIQYKYYEYDYQKTLRQYAIETIISNGVSFFLISCQIGFWAYFYFTKKNQGRISDLSERITRDQE